MMMKIASILGKKQDEKKFKNEYDAIKKSINDRMWNNDFYYDRYWDGTFSTHKAASNFYPMIAGAPDDRQVEKILQHLESDKEFRGDYVLPTISRDNPAFKDQQYWRGTIWPPTNYLVYQGLKRYGLDESAAEFAIKSASLFLKSWQTFGLCRENYNSITGEGGGQRYQSWGPLFALILLEEFIDISPFDGLRVGNLAASKPNSIDNISLGNCVYSLEVDNRSLVLSKNGTELFHYKGKAVLRRIETTDKTLVFEAHVIGDAVDFYPSVFKGKPFRVKSEGQPIVTNKEFIRSPKGTTKIIIKK
jgi:glycogen debranching enzyme